MTLKLNFKEANLKKLLNHIKWLEEIGLISSYEFQSIQDKIEAENSSRFIKEMIDEAEEDIKNGRVYTSEEAKQILSQRQASK